MDRWVGFGVIADKLINIGRAMEQADPAALRRGEFLPRMIGQLEVRWSYC
jgi:hypothetical protein